MLAPLRHQLTLRTSAFRSAVAALPVADEDRTGYDRGLFRHWIEADATAAAPDPRYCWKRPSRPQLSLVGAPPTAAAGKAGTTTPTSTTPVPWTSTTSSRWRRCGTPGPPPGHLSGANAMPTSWTSPGRCSRSPPAQNRQKADQDPFQWLPDDAVRCRYVADWTAVKACWRLSVGPVEMQTLTDLAVDCPNTPVDVTTAD